MALTAKIASVKVTIFNNKFFFPNYMKTRIVSEIIKTKSQYTHLIFSIP